MFINKIIYSYMHIFVVLFLKKYMCKINKLEKKCLVINNQDVDKFIFQNRYNYFR